MSRCLQVMSGKLVGENYKRTYLLVDQWTSISSDCLLLILG